MILANLTNFGSGKDLEAIKAMKNSERKTQVTKN